MEKVGDSCGCGVLSCIQLISPKKRGLTLLQEGRLINLVGGFKPLQYITYSSQTGSSLQVGEKIKNHLKPPPRKPMEFGWSFFRIGKNANSSPILWHGAFAAAGRRRILRVNTRHQEMDGHSCWWFRNLVNHLGCIQKTNIGINYVKLPTSTSAIISFVNGISPFW